MERLAAEAWADAATLWGQLFASLAAEGWTGDAWRAHIASRTARDGNAFTLGSEVGHGLARAARVDLRALEAIAAPALLTAVAANLERQGYRVLPPTDLGPRRPDGLAATLYGQGGWEEQAEALRDAAQAGAAGPFATPWAFRWEAGSHQVVPVVHPDLQALDELVGYTAERAQVLQNTRRLVAGLPAADVLLYGDRGTGKSSTVKALGPAFAAQGLRLVELGRRDLTDLPELAERLTGAPQRFIVFVDDLSFEEDDATYKDVKTALQGGLRARPANVCVYATSNRRHLVRERLSERDTDDPRGGDGVEEKLSLADRFGLTVVFAAPDQRLYLEIVRGLARARGLELDREALDRQALRWALWHNGRSGRTARQFVETLAERP